MTFSRSIVCGAGMLICLAAVGTFAQQLNGRWPATSKTAMSITGDIALGPDKLALNFQSYPIAEIRKLTPEETVAVFADEGDKAGYISDLYRVDIPATAKMLHKNTLCGASGVQWMVTSQRGKSLSVAFFSGAKPPALTVDAVSESTSLCGTYSYQR